MNLFKHNLLKFKSLALSLVFLTSSCTSYRQNILFRTEKEVIPEKLLSASHFANQNYLIQSNDYLEIEVYTRNGERIIDPDFELTASVANNNMLNRGKEKYMVRTDGFANLPLIGEIKLAGLTLEQANTLLQDKYDNYYKDSFVQTKYVNKRVTVLGAGGGKVIPLENENTTLIEILALYGGLDNTSKGNNIRLIRGDLKDPE
ncbi:polysaccharide biosynthesis/export family protein [Xanthovirga aplysinae]|uniref:polysaccharide biosynthesis/export family protein n=1 Tax=Xanthovirga aplysinae TaxID=2529853 RepID=UPI001FECA09C|nr:polysaccharide biosynthesis/export family protein [Xanthovirga aplysinae]